MLSNRGAVRYGSGSGEVTGITIRFEECGGIRDTAMRVGRIVGVSADNVRISSDREPGMGTIATYPLAENQTVDFSDRIVYQVGGHKLDSNNAAGEIFRVSDYISIQLDEH